MTIFRNGYALTGLAMLLVGSVGLGFYGVLGESGQANEIFRFISLLIIFMAALAAAATVFFGLGIGNSAEAFGLPAGSVRALLAMGIMILFVVFGLPLVTTPDDAPVRIADEPLRTAVVPATELDRAIAQHSAQSLVVIVTDYGRAAGAAGAADTGAPARFDVYQKVRARPGEELDVARQVLTAIVTLLTTVVGFYFGSRSAAEGLREVAASLGTTGGLGGTADPLGPAGPAAAKDLSDIEAKLTAARALLAEKKKSPPAGSEAAVKAAEAADVQADRALKGARDAVAAAATAVTALSKATTPAERDILDGEVRLKREAFMSALVTARAAQVELEAKIAAIG